MSDSYKPAEYYQSLAKGKKRIAQLRAAGFLEEARQLELAKLEMVAEVEEAASEIEVIDRLKLKPL